MMGTQKVSRQGRSFEQKITDVMHPDSEGRVQEFWRFFEDQGKADKFMSS